MENWLISLLIVAILIVGGLIGYAIKPTTECEVCEECEICIPPTEKVCDPCVQEICEVCEPCVCDYEKAETKNTPNEDLVENNELTEEEEKHARVQTVFMTCDKWQTREMDNGNLIGNCWKEKRNIVELEPRRNGNQCAILSTSGC